MPCVLKEVQISNFKSLRNLKVSLGEFNVIVGKNASGKTNFIEFFKFLKNALVEERRPYMPYIEWWSYRNIVWEGKEELPIEAKLKFEIDGYNLEYKVAFSGIGGTFRITNEQLTIDKFVLIKREEQTLRIRHSKEFISLEAKKIEKLLEEAKATTGLFREIIGEITKDDLLDKTITLPSDFSNLFSLKPVFSSSHKNLTINFMYIPSEIKAPLTGIFLFFTAQREKDKPPRLFLLLDEFESAIESFTILRHPNMKEIKSPCPPRKEEVLMEDAANLNTILNNFFYKLGGKFPERVEKAILKLFPNIRISPHWAPDGRVFLKMYDKGVELDPPCIPDGLYKILAILAAIELKPSLLAIDEIENSLYAEALEYVIDELKSSGITVIITTHSPIVVDMVELEDLFIAERTLDGTVMKKIINAEKIREKLRELKITQSESWIYGELTK